MRFINDCIKRIVKWAKQYHYIIIITGGLLKNKTVKLESLSGQGNFKKGRLGRTLAYIRLADGRDFGQVMIEKE